MHEAVDPAKVHERAEVHDRADRALAPLALLERLEERLAALALRLLEEGAAGQHDVVPVAVELDDLRLELGADERVQVADATQVHQRRGQEPTEPDVQDQAALDDLDHRPLDRLAGGHDRLDPSPGALVLRPLLGQDQPALLVLLLQDEGLDLVAHLDDLVRVDVVADREFLARDHALGLVADIEQDLVAVDLHDLAVDDVAVVEVLERGLHRRDQFLGRQVALECGGGGGRLGDRSCLGRGGLVRGGGVGGLGHLGGRCGLDDLGRLGVGGRVGARGGLHITHGGGSPHWHAGLTDSQLGICERRRRPAARRDGR